MNKRLELEQSVRDWLTNFQLRNCLVLRNQEQIVIKIADEIEAGIIRPEPRPIYIDPARRTTVPVPDRGETID